ncbi:MAG: dephospho-CoA kinase [Proteobacteria bacterium]|nr:dephospho-CoA kinase [Pseudomonadota bacterium]
MAKLYVLGLTGSIGMGKTTTAEMFRDAGIAVWDADAAVHELYTSHEATISGIAEIVPAAVGPTGVSREILRNFLQADKDLFSKLEKIVHPAIRMHRDAFLDKCRELDLKLAVVDIPLLYETGAEKWLDGVLVVTIDAVTQRDRVMGRKGMTMDTFKMLMDKQLPDCEKRKRADFVIETKTLDHVRSEVNSLIEKLGGNTQNA